MNITTTRGFVALALLCLLPRLGANPITQTATLETGSEAHSPHALMGSAATWNYSLYNGGAPLTNVLLTETITFSGSGFEFNPFNYAFGYSYSYTPVHSISIAGYSAELLSVISGYSFASASGVLAPHTTVYYSGSRTFTFEHSFTSQAELAQFIGSGTGTFWEFAGAYGNSEWGSDYSSATAVVQLTFNAPDSGSTLALLLLPVLGLAVVRRRIL